MTLLLNEIHITNRDLRDSVIIFAADGRLSKRFKFFATTKKIFRIDYLNAGVGFFGLAEFTTMIGKRHMVADWLANFINKNSKINTLKEFANTLGQELGSVIPKETKLKHRLGIHLAGFRKDGLPEFWFLRNSQNDTLLESFNVSEQFLSSAARDMGYDGKNPILPEVFSFIQIFRNGDIRSHAIVEEDLNKIMNNFFSLSDFKKPSSVSDYENFVRFKMKIIADIYAKYCRDSVIGTPIDVFSITPSSSGKLD